MGERWKVVSGRTTKALRYTGRWAWERRVACVFALVMVASTVLLAARASSVPAAPPCLPGEYRAAELSRGVQAMSLAAPSSTTLEVADAGETQIELGRAIAPARTQIALQTDVMPQGITIDDPIGVRVHSFRKDKGGDVNQAVLAWGTFTSRQTAEILLCVERQGPGDDTRYAFYLEPGRFTGAVTILDDRLPVVTIPFTVELAHPDPYGPLAPIGVVVLAGTLYLMVLRRPAGGGDDPIGMGGLDAFLRRPSGIAAVVAGTAATVGVYTTTYLSNDTWGSAGGDFFLLVGAMFTAFVSAGTAFRFASNLGSGDRPALTSRRAPDAP